MTTTVFEIAEREGYGSMTELAAAMGVTRQHLYAVRNGKHKIGVKFIRGAMRAFPRYPADVLFPREALMGRVS